MLLLLFLLHLSVSTTAVPIAYTCDGAGLYGGGGNYTANSTFGSNLNLLLASLSTTKTNFTTDSKGSVPYRVYGLILCRGNVSPSNCATCLKDAADDVLSLCPSSKQATVWYDNCQLRYAGLSFFSTVDEPKFVVLSNRFNASDQEVFVKMETELLDNLTNLAAYNSSLMFATGTITAGRGSQPKVNALAQCTRDLSADNCRGCLQLTRTAYRGLEMKQGGQVFGQSCNFRYDSESSPFFARKPTVSLVLSTAPPPYDQPTPSIPVAIGLVLIFIIGICFWRRSSSTAKQLHQALL